MASARATGLAGAAMPAAQMTAAWVARSRARAAITSRSDRSLIGRSRRV